MQTISGFAEHQIYTNPNDLEFSITEDPISRKFTLNISRGPGHNQFPLYSSGPSGESFQIVLNYTKEVLERLYCKITWELEYPYSWSSQVINPNNLELNDADYLTPEQIICIITQLKKNRSAKTYEMF